MSILEYNEELHLKTVHSEGFEEGYDKAKAEFNEIITQKDAALAEKDDALAKKNARIAELEALLAESKSNTIKTTP